MSSLFNSRFGRLEVVDRGVGLTRSGGGSLECCDLDYAVKHIRSRFSDYASMRMLRKAVADHHGISSGGMANEAVLRLFARLLVTGRVDLRPGWRPRLQASQVEPNVAVDLITEVVGEQEQEQKQYSLGFKVVDDLSETELEGVEIILEKPDGNTEKLRTDSGGEATINGLVAGRYCATSDFSGKTLEEVLAFVKIGPNPSRRNVQAEADHERLGRCTVVAMISEHRVRTGETLEGLAHEAGLTTEELAEFNWGTSDAGEVNDALSLMVGCTKLDPETGDYMLDSGDRPGLIYIPRRWQRNYVALDDVHYLRVKVLPEPRPFLFSV